MEAITTQEVLLPTEPRFLSWFAESLGSDSFDDTIDVVLARQGDRPGRSPRDEVP